MRGRVRCKEKVHGEERQGRERGERTEIPGMGGMGGWGDGGIEVHGVRRARR
jgi:hypothetical protein